MADKEHGSPQSDIEVVRDQRIVLRRLYLENRSHRMFTEMKSALDFARILRRDQVLFLESKGLYCVEARAMEARTSRVTHVPGVVPPEQTEE